MSVPKAMSAHICWGSEFRAIFSVYNKLLSQHIKNSDWKSSGGIRKLSRNLSTWYFLVIILNFLAITMPYNVSLYLKMSSVSNGNFATCFNKKDTLQNQVSSKTIYFIRHGISEMNEKLSIVSWGSPNFADAGIWDARLSSRGIKQATSIHLKWKKELAASQLYGGNGIPWDNIEAVYASPLTRTLQTAETLLYYSNPPLLQSKVPKIAQPLLRERLYLSSDVGRPKKDLQSEFKDWNFNNILNNNPWWYQHDSKGEGSYTEWRPKGKYLCEGEATAVFIERMKALKLWLTQLPEKNVIVVSHWGVLRALTGISFSNCELRAVKDVDLLDEPFIDPDQF